jgi:DNA-binding YbaB/EbfC family protein
MPQPPNLQAMLAQAQEMMAKQQEAQEALKDERVETSAGGGMVKVVVTGAMRVENLTIDPEAVDPEDVDMLQDLVLAAINQALGQAEEIAARKMEGISGADFDPMSALDSLGLGGALGGLGGGGGGGGAPGLPPGAGGGNRAARRAQKKR